MIDIPYEVILHNEFEKEFKAILKKYSDRKKKILAVYRHKTYVLQKAGPDVLCTDNNFEKVRGSDSIFEIRLTKGRPNLRVLFSFLDENRIIYLLIFYEKDKKKDYDKYRRIAEKRLRDYILMEGD